MRTRAAALLGISALGVVTLSGQSGRGAATDFPQLDLNGRGMALTAPPGATVFPGGTAGSAAGGSYESDMRLETPLSVSQIASHYASQILAAKWREEGRQADDENIVAVRFSGATATGDPLTFLLTVTRLGGTRTDVAVRFVRHRPVPSAVSRGVPGPQTPPVPPGRAGGGGASARAGTPPTRLVQQQTLESILRADALTTTQGEPYEVQSTMPPGFPRELLPAGATVGIAAMAKSMVTVVATAPSFSITSVTRHVLSLGNSGWRMNTGRTLGGFGGSAVYAEVCNAPKVATLRFSPRESGGIHIRAAVSSPGACSMPRAGPFADVAIPVLFHPPGIRMTESSGGGGLESHHWRTVIDTAQSAASLASHHADLMTKSGWPLAGRVDDAGMSVTRYGSTTLSGEPITAILSVMPLAGTPSVDLWLRVVRHSPPRR